MPREVVVGELKLGHPHSDHDSRQLNKVIVYLHIPLAASLFMMVVAQ